MKINYHGNCLHVIQFISQNRIYNRQHNSLSISLRLIDRIEYVYELVYKEQ